jgi:hypothetical protein
MNTGYKEMLRDRCPKVVSLALKYCKAKETWLNHVYKNWIWIYKSKKERLDATKRLLGSKSKPFCFADTIDWENLNKEEKSYWETIQTWVSWFQNKYAYMQNAYSISKSKGYKVEDIKYELMLNFMLELCPSSQDDTKTKKMKNKKVNELADFLIESFEQ